MECTSITSMPGLLHPYRRTTCCRGWTTSPTCCGGPGGSHRPLWCTPISGCRARRPDVKRVVVVSRLVERKGIGNVVTAMADLPGVELVIAGGPPRDSLRDDAEACRLMQLAEATGVADRVEFRGNVERSALPAL